MSVDCLEHFGCLDELAQVIYQGFYRFVVLSNVEHDKWTVHLGLSGQEGRWWQGAFNNADILKVAGSKPSAKILEALAERLASAFKQGELTVDNWSPDEGAKINLALGPVSKTPLHIPLVELSPQEAAAHATKILFELALQAQSRNCRLGTTGPVVSVTTEAPPSPRKNTGSTAPVTAPVPSSSSTREQQALEEVKALKAALASEKKRQKSPSESAKASTSASRPPKGASLANPSKKARKYQALEFESDED